ncbi:hypothetical protein ACIBG8_36690 [Nonomuraea sp. NPDC050556]|uniref:hypothetical protein n=1 Tax=Nonomuraea sp. NPDC050556 TaxID=3364369 RepID=UPI00378A74E3
MSEDALESATSARSFREALIDLYTRSGSPSHPVLSASARQYTDLRIAKSTLYDLRNRTYADALPKLDFVTVVVAGCLALGGASASEVEAETARWEQHWRRILSDQNEPVPLRRPSAHAPSGPALSDASARALLKALVTEPRRRVRLAVAVVAVAAAIGLTLGITVANAAGEPPALTAFAPCAEGVVADPGAAYTVLLFEPGPPGNPYPVRQVELRTQVSRGQWIVWSHLDRPTSQLDKVWLEWSYHQRPGDPSQVRRCGPQLVSRGAQTPGVMAWDGEDNKRWFRACAQPPEAEWTPGRDGIFCTSWTRPDI